MLPILQGHSPDAGHMLHVTEKLIYMCARHVLARPYRRFSTVPDSSRTFIRPRVQQIWFYHNSTWFFRKALKQETLLFSTLLGSDDEGRRVVFLSLWSC